MIARYAGAIGRRLNIHLVPSSGKHGAHRLGSRRMGFAPKTSSTLASRSRAAEGPMFFVCAGFGAAGAADQGNLWRLGISGRL